MLAPALASIRRAHPSAYIEVAGAVWRLRLLAGPTLANAVTPFEGFFRDGQVLGKELARFERIVVFSIDLEDPMVRALADAAAGRIELHRSFPMDPTNELHVIDHIQRALSGLNIEQKADGHYRLPVPESANGFAEQFLANTGGSGEGRRVYVQSGSKIVTKRWPAERFISLCRHLVQRLSCRLFMGC